MSDDMMVQTNKQQQAIDELERSRVILTPGQIVMKQFMRNKLAIVGAIVIIFMVLFCYVGPLFSPYGETELFYLNTATGEEIRMSDKAGISGNEDVILNIKSSPSKGHLLGTSELGCDVLTRLMYGGRISLMVGFLVVALEIVIGVILGCIAGYYGKWVDMLVMRAVEILNSIPFIPLMLIISSVLISLEIPPAKKIYYTMFILGLLYWPGVARMIRGNVLSLREMEYMQAAEATGLKVRRKIFGHLVPNLMPLIIVIATMDLGGVIIAESTMSFLGIGVAAPYASWGNMVSSVTNDTVMRNCPFIWVPPGLCILFTVMAFNFVGDGLRDAFDPRMKR
jgi:peptide/nickel transport system permease protein